MFIMLLACFNFKCQYKCIIAKTLAVTSDIETFSSIIKAVLLESLREQNATLLT